MIADNDLLSIQQARILAENAREAQAKLAAFPQETLDAGVECLAKAIVPHIRELALMSQEETGYGNPADKEFKNRFVCEQLPERLRGMRCVGVLNDAADGRIVEVGVPLGVIVALCPVTSPVSTAIYKTLLAVKSGNAIIFSPHPGATKSITRALEILSAAAVSCGLPEGCVSHLRTVTKSGTLELMGHPATSLLMITGVPGMFREARCLGKPIIYGGTGNGPAFVERSANLRRAAKDIVTSKTFDNGIAPSAEQSIVVDAPVAREFTQALRACGAYFMNEEESHRLAALLFCADGRRKKGVIGLPAATLARRAEIPAPEGTTILVAERKYVSESDPYSGELLSPVLACYVEDDWLHACDKCLELLLHDRNAHTMIIHSEDREVIRQFALKKPVGRLLVNTPGALGGMGVGTGLFPAMSLGCGASGIGITPDNVSPMNLIYIRKVGYGAEPTDERATGAEHPARDNGDTDQSQKIQALRRILLEAAKVLDEPGQA